MKPFKGTKPPPAAVREFGNVRRIIMNRHLDEVKPEGSVNEVLQQVAFADKTLLNKVDLVTPEEKEKLRERLATINKFTTFKLAPAHVHPDGMPYANTYPYPYDLANQSQHLRLTTIAHLPVSVDPTSVDPTPVPLLEDRVPGVANVTIGEIAKP